MLKCSKVAVAYACSFGVIKGKKSLNETNNSGLKVDF